MHWPLGQTLVADVQVIARSHLRSLMRWKSQKPPLCVDYNLCESTDGMYMGHAHKREP